MPQFEIWPQSKNSSPIWTADDRVADDRAMAFQMAYGQKEAIKITKEAAN
jgi:hypothetical protein